MLPSVSVALILKVLTAVATSVQVYVWVHVIVVLVQFTQLCCAPTCSQFPMVVLVYSLAVTLSPSLSVMFMVNVFWKYHPSLLGFTFAAVSFGVLLTLKARSSLSCVLRWYALSAIMVTLYVPTALLSVLHVQL